MLGIRRREFIKLLGSVAAWPIAARAQQLVPVVGFLSGASPQALTGALETFRRSLNGEGYAEGKNVALEYRWAEGQYDRLNAMAADLVRREVSVIVIAGAAVPAVLAAQRATSTIPIIFELGIDPVPLGLVASLSRPSTNMTGIVGLGAELGAKELGLLHELVPTAHAVAMIVNPKNQNAMSQVADVQVAARTLGKQLMVLNASTEHELYLAFESLAQQGIAAMVVGADGFFRDRRDQIIALAAGRAIATIYPYREYSDAGGLMSYGPDLYDLYRQLGIYTGRVLKGQKPADLPVMRATKFELVINLKTARTLGLTIPSGVLAIADDVIE